jgi:hypothetical protein
MKMNKRQRKQFEQIAREMMKFLNNEGDPHTRVVIDQTSAEVTQADHSYLTTEYIKD